MKFLQIIVLLAAVSFSSASVALPSSAVFAARSPEFEDLVNYLQYHVSPNDIDDMLRVLPEALAAIPEDGDSGVEPRSFIDDFLWTGIIHAMESLAKGNPKFSKVVKLVSDPKFRELVKKAINSKTLRSFLKNITKRGFKFTDFVHLLVNALCSVATTIQKNKFVFEACEILKSVA